MKGLKDLKAPIVAELIGTFALCFIGAGAVCTNHWTGGALGLLGIAIAHGTVLAVMISSLGHISGGHFNPAVTLGILTMNKIEGQRAFLYILAQLIGAAVAGLLLRLIVPENIWQPVNLGTPTLGLGITAGQGVVIEIILTFFLVLAVCGTAVDPKGSWNAIAGFGIGSVLIFDILVGGPLTGAAMNPARAFGPALASNHWASHVVYWLGPLSGGVFAGFLYSRLFLGEKHR